MLLGGLNGPRYLCRGHVLLLVLRLVLLLLLLGMWRS